MKFKITLFATLCLLQITFSQTTLSAGDIAIVGFNLGTNTVRVAILKSLAVNTTVYFTDMGWLYGTPSAWSTTSSGSKGEGVITWTTSDAVPAGTILDINIPGTSSTNTTVKTVATSPVSQTISVSGLSSGDPMLNGGDNFFIYQGSTSSPTFIAGFNDYVQNLNPPGLDTTGWVPNGNFTTGFGTTTNLPSTLTNGVNALGMTGSYLNTNVQYTGPITAADSATWLTRFMTLSNWSYGATATNTITNSLTFTGSLAVFENQNLQNKIYPNPATTEINVNLSENQKVDIYTIDGKLVKSVDAKKGDNKIDVNTLPKGNYILKTKEETQKFIKK